MNIRERLSKLKALYRTLGYPDAVTLGTVDGFSIKGEGRAFIPGGEHALDDPALREHQEKLLDYFQDKEVLVVPLTKGYHLRSIYEALYSGTFSYEEFFNMRYGWAPAQEVHMRHAYRISHYIIGDDIQEWKGPWPELHLYANIFLPESYLLTSITNIV